MAHHHHDHHHDLRQLVRNRAATTAPALDKGLPNTLFAGPYWSSFLDTHPKLEPLLQQLNCSHFSTRGQAPNLLELKQHAHALLVLIKHITVAESATPVDDPDSAVALAVKALRDQVERDNEDLRLGHERAKAARPDAKHPDLVLHEAVIKAIAFDFVADLGTPYTNADETHQVALTGLMNVLEDRGSYERQGREHCPLHQAILFDNPPERQRVALPYATTSALVKHVDELLERLDHEFGAEGGVLGMLPLTNDKDKSTATNLLGQKSVLGQWIAFTRGLVLRNHEIQMNLIESLEIISGEAVVPKMMLFDSVAQGSLNAPASDRFIINVKPGSMAQLDSAFKVAENNSRSASGGTTSGSDIGDKDLMTITVKTQYSRLRGGTTIFITPTTVEPRHQEGVIQVVKGEWRNRSSLWEQRNNDELQRLKLVELQFDQVVLESQSRKQAIDTLLQERQAYLLAGGKLPVSRAVKEQLKREIWGNDVLQARQDLDRETEALRLQREALDRREVQVDSRQAAMDANWVQRRATFNVRDDGT